MIDDLMTQFSCGPENAFQVAWDCTSVSYCLSFRYSVVLPIPEQTSRRQFVAASFLQGPQDGSALEFLERQQLVTLRHAVASTILQI